MAVTNTQPKNFISNVLSKNLTFTGSSADTFKVHLMDTTYTFNASTDINLGVANVASHILAASGSYAAATATMGSASVSGSSTTLAATAVSWTNGTSSSFAAAGAAVVYKSTGSASTDTVVNCIDFGADYTVAPTQTFQITFASGFLVGTLT